MSTNRRVGFRYFALATGNDTDTSLVEKEKYEQGSKSHGIYFHCYPIIMVGLYLKHMEQAGGIEHSTPWQSSAPQCRTRASTRWLLHGPRGSRLPLPRGRAFRHRRRRRSLDQGVLARHRTVGDCRASLYNALPREAVARLCVHIKRFQEANP